MRLNHRSALALAAMGLSVALVAGCGHSSSGPGMGTLRVQMTDAPGDFDEVNLVVTEVSVRREFATGDTDSVSDTAGNWIVLSDGAKTYDLMDLRNGVFTTIGEADLRAGHYSQMRLRIGAGSTVVVDGVSHPLVVPSGAQSGLKIVGDFTVREGSTTEIGLDFDAARSVFATGNGTWMLRPVVRLMHVANAGAITGQVVPDSTAATVWVLQSPDSIASTAVRVDGTFRFSLLPAGTYAVRVEADSGWRDTTIAGITVAAGGTTNLGAVALTSAP